MPFHLLLGGPFTKNLEEPHFDEALPEIVASLTNPEERVRYMALHVLTFHFQLKDYKPAAIEMLLHDPDEDCREQAANGLGALMEDTKDPESLHVLAQVVRNENETKAVRTSAYASMFSVVHYDRRQQQHLTETLFKPGFTFDWDFVD